MKKILVLLSIFLLTGCYTTLKTTSNNGKSQTRTTVQFSVADEGDYCYTEKYYERIYVKDRYSAKRVISVPRYRLNCISEPYGYYYSRFYWRYNDGNYYYNDYYHNDDYEYEYNYRGRQNKRSYRPRRGTIGRSANDEDSRSVDRSVKSRDRDRDNRRGGSSRSGRERERGSKDSEDTGS